MKATHIEEEEKLWKGQLYLSHTSEITTKLLYKKFYRNNDVTILFGKWNHILHQQSNDYYKELIESPKK